MDLRKFKSELSIGHKVLRVTWGICWLVLFRPSPRPLHGWRRFLLRLFGARIGRGVRIYSSAKIYYPPNLVAENFVVIGPDVDVYCVAEIKILESSMVSQYSYLCAASHDYREDHLPLLASPITIGPRTWICARAFIGPGVKIEENVVVAACAVVVNNVAANHVVGGNPAKVIKVRAVGEDRAVANAVESCK